MKRQTPFAVAPPGQARDGGAPKVGLVDLNRLFEPDSIMPAQWNQQRAPRLPPDAMLKLAVLEQAVETVLGAAAAKGQDVAADREWFATDDHAWPFSFVAICEVLDFDAAAIRTKVLGAMPTVGRRKTHHIAGHRGTMRIVA